MRTLKNGMRFHMDEDRFSEKRGVVDMQVFDWKQLREDTLEAIADKVNELSAGTVEMVQLEYGGDSVMIGYMTSASKEFANHYKEVLKAERKARNARRRARK